MSTPQAASSAESESTIQDTASANGAVAQARKTRNTSGKRGKAGGDEDVRITPGVYVPAYLLFGAFFRLGGVRIYGRENVPRRGPVIIAPNHVSMLDPPLTGWITPRVLRVMAKQELFSTSSLPRRIFTYLIRGIGSFPVNRGQPDRKALRNAIEVLQAGHGVLIFPEGKRSEDGTLGEAEPGLGMIAHKTKAPIVPVYLEGTEAAWSRLHPGLRLCRTAVYFGKPLYFEEEYSRRADRETLDAIGRRVMQEIARLRDEAHSSPRNTRKDAKEN